MKTCLIRDNFTDLSFLELCGINLIKGVKPTIIDQENKIIENCNFVGAENENSNPIAEFSENSYLLIPKGSATILFDLTKTTVVDRVIISGFFEKGYDFTLSDYQIYISDSVDTLFDKKSNAVNYINKNIPDTEIERNNCDQIFDLTDYRGRYVAIKINKCNNDDGIIRIGSVYVCNNDITDSLTFSRDTFADNLVKGAIPTVKGSYTADLSYLTNGICFDEKTRVTLNCETEYIFSLPQNTHVTSVGIVGAEQAIQSAQIFGGNTREELTCEENLKNTEIIPCATPKSNVGAVLLTLEDDFNYSYIGIKFPVTDGFLDQIVIEGDTDFPTPTETAE